MGLNAAILFPPPAPWTQTARDPACCLEPDSEGLLPRLGGTHCTLGKHPGSAQIRGFLEAAGCLGREAGSRRNIWVHPILSFHPPQPLQRPALRATALPPGCATWGQAQ